MGTGIAWVIAMVIGLGAGGLVLHFPGGGEGGLMPAVFGFLLGVVNGLLVGILGWLAVGLPRGSAARLIGAFALMVGVTHGLNDGFNIGLPFWLMQALPGLAVAAIVVRVLRMPLMPVAVVAGVAWAVAIVIASWTGDLVGLPWTQTQLGWAQDHAWDGTVTGLIWGITTAVVGLPAAFRRRT